jgi:hypothetical protein
MKLSITQTHAFPWITCVTRFLTSGFFHQTIQSGPLIHGLKHFRICFEFAKLFNKVGAWAMSLTLLRPPQRCQWHHSGRLRFTGTVSRDFRPLVFFIKQLIHGLMPFCTWLGIREDIQQLCRITSRIQSHIRKRFNPWIRGPDGIVRWKKTRGRKSRDTIPLIAFGTFCYQRLSMDHYTLRNILK